MKQSNATCGVLLYFMIAALVLCAPAAHADDDGSGLTVTYSEAGARRETEFGLFALNGVGHSPIQRFSLGYVPASDGYSRGVRVHLDLGGGVAQGVGTEWPVGFYFHVGPYVSVGESARSILGARIGAGLMLTRYVHVGVLAEKGVGPHGNRGGAGIQFGVVIPSRNR